MRPKYQPERGLGRRNIFCGFYGRCLDLAIKKSWEKWHCSHCRHSDNREAAPEMILTVNHPIPYYEFVR